MNYLIVESVSKSFGEKVLFENITFGIERGQKIGLIARNGKGKSTLLDIIAGKTIADSGEVVFRKGIKVLYLPQDPDTDINSCVIDAVLSADSEQAFLINQYERLIAISSSKWDNEQKKLFEKISERISELDAWGFESRVKEVLGRLKIHDFDKKCGELSGGQLKKVALAKVLIEDGDFLILDEPTNHLDIETIEWMEEFLQRSQLSLLIVTHDRFFLDQVCNSIIELDNNEIYHYRGDYSYYLEKKAEKDSIETVVTAKQKALYLKELEWMRRMPKARGTKSKARTQEFQNLKRRVQNQHTDKTPEFFVKIDRLGGKIMEINNVHKSFGDRKIVDDFSYTFKRFDKVGLVGPNGIGKSTLLDMISGELAVDKGRIVKGKTVKAACFKQNVAVLDNNRRVIDIVKDIAEEVYIDDKRSISVSKFLTMFGIDHDIQHNYAFTLSGGEKRKLQLLMVLMEQPNFLMLDEPTNDLDIQTLQSLEDFLENFKGCLLVASHDRFFLNKIVEHIFVFEGKGKIKDFYGNYTQYVEHKKREKRRLTKTKKENNVSVGQRKKKRDPDKPTWKEEKEFLSLTKDIDELEKRKKDFEQKLNSGESDHEKLLAWSVELSKIIEELDEKSERWLFLSEKIDNY